jgi:hypothetical protein
LTTESDNTLRRFEWLLPTLLAALAATRFAPLATPATLLLLCYLPGRFVVAGFGLGANWDAAGRAVLALATSLAITPVVLNPIWHVTNSAWPLLGCVWLLLTVGCWLSRMLGKSQAPMTEARLFDQTRTKVVVTLIAALVAFAAIGTYWPTELRGYPVPALIHDFIKHHAVLFSLEQRPLPLGNPFYADEAAGPVYYYHFFYLIPATLRVFAPGVSIELAFGVQSALVGIAFAAMCYLIVKRFTGGDGPATLAALLATAVGGLDIIPVLILRLPVVTLDAWGDYGTFRIHNLLTQIVWTGQNMQGLLVAMLGVHCLSVKRWWKGWFVLGPLLGAAIIGASVWFAVVLLPGLAVFVVIEVVAQRRQRTVACKRFVGSALVALLMLALSWPSLAGYSEMAQRQQVGLTTRWPRASTALLGKLAPPGILANLLDYPWVLVIEFGPLLLFPVLLPRHVWRRAWRDAGLRLLLLSSALALVGFVVVRSNFIYNAFGQRIIMVPMAAGVVLGGCILSPATRRRSLLNPLGWSLHGQTSDRPRRLLACFVGLILFAGLPVGVYQSPLAAVRRYITRDSVFHVLASKLGQRAADEAAAGRFLRYHLPADAVLQAYWGTERLHIAQIARKQLGVSIIDPDTVIFHPRDMPAFEIALREVSEVLQNPTAARKCYQTLRAHGITHVFVGTVERELWRGLDKFSDERFFERLFHDQESSIYALR